MKDNNLMKYKEMKRRLMALVLASSIGITSFGLAGCGKRKIETQGETNGYYDVFERDNNLKAYFTDEWFCDIWAEDYDNNKLSGIMFELRDGKNNLVDQWTSSNEPHRIKGLDKGKYILTEINVVGDYMTANNNYTYEIEAGINKYDVLAIKHIKKGNVINQRTSNVRRQMTSGQIEMRDDMAERVAEKKKQKQEALLMSAFELFTSKGINNTSISDIAKQAKMAKGTFYLYFKDKYDIRDRLIANKASKLFECAKEAMENQEFSGLEDKVIFLVNHVVDQLNENKALMRFISKNLSWAMFSHIRISNMGNMNCMDIFDDILGESDRNFRQRELMIYMIVELVSASCYSVILNGTPCSLEELKPELDRAICGLMKQFEE